ncbi:hypothetical protein ERX27_10770 [Macrococcus brunensis]|uniref:Uncharacterized protein n=1 Tax=Macrococcus brunensis TaxID=198483 RepID=A0A4R6BAM2_9STAP|nr:hypothetical protein [Macrococcus brunensis]TDL93343.1 hypothetical protein ERX27_10770 [Macrococcus brunensis]
MSSTTKNEIDRKFKGKIFKNENIKDLITFFRKTYEESDDPDMNMILSIKYKDGLSVSGIDDEILKDTEMIESLSFWLRDYRESKKISVIIFEDGGHYSVAGSDENWVRAKINVLDEYFSKLLNQNKFLSNSWFQFSINFIFTLILSLSIYRFIHRNLLSEELQNDDLFGLVLNLLFTFLSYVFLFLLTKSLYNLYPTIEFDTVRDYLNKSKKRKSYIVKTLGFLITVILIPIFLDLIIK